jgi:hypothetical protein
MPVINGVYLKDFAALPSAVDDANIIPIAISGNQVAYRTTVSGIITDARITGKLLTGLSVTGTAILATDTILQAFGKVQNQLNNRVSSVGLTMPVAFSVANSPVTGSGTLAVSAVGLASQYIRGDGQLASFPSAGAGGSSVYYYLNGSIDASVATYKQMANTAVIGAGTDFNLTGNGLIAQFLTDSGNPNRLQIPGGAWNFEMYFNKSSNGGNSKFYVELLKYNGTTFTSIASSSAIPEEITGGTTIDLYITSLAVPETALLLTDRLAIRVYIVDNSGGRTATLHTENGTICQIITTFAGGISALNGLTTNNQYFAVGSTGTDFNISSSVDTHTFNIPSASASNIGLITTGTQTIAGDKTFTGDNLFINSRSYFTETDSTASYTGYTQLNCLPNSFSFLNSGSSKVANFNYGTGVLTYDLPSVSGTLALTSALSGYLPLTGGTLTGALSGTSATFSGDVSSTNGKFYVVNTYGYYFGGSANLTGWQGSNGTQIIQGLTAGSEKIRITSGGAVLINTTTDAGYKLDVNGTGRFRASAATYAGGSLILTSSAGTNPIYLTSNGGYFALSNGGGGDHLLIASTGAATFSSSVTAGGTGNVGLILRQGTSTDRFKLFVGSGSPYIADDNYISSLNTDLHFLAGATGTTEILKLASTGVATFSSSIQNTLLKPTTGLQFFWDSGNRGGIYAQSSIAGGATNYSTAMFAETGYGLNFWVDGGVLKGLQIATTGAATFSSLGTGTVTATSGTLSTVSDSAYKVDAGFIDSALDKVMNLKPRYFYWNEKSGLPKDVKQLGFYAQEVNEALGEEAANTPATEDIPWGITDRSVIAMLTKAIQELKAEIDILKAK